MNDFSAKKGETLTNQFDIMRKIETMSAETPYAIKQFKAQVLSFLSMDRRLSSLKSKTEKRANARTLDRFEAFVAEYQGAYKRCNQSHASINKSIDEVGALYSRLADFYYSDGKRREAKRATSDGEKYDKLARKQLSLVFSRIADAVNISLAKEERTMPELREEYFEKAKPEVSYEAAKRDSGARIQREEFPRYNQQKAGASYNVSSQYNQNPQFNQNPQYASASQYGQNPQYNPNNAPYNAPGYQQGGAYAYPQQDYRIPPHYYQPMQNVNITPISIDVNSAVETLFESFVRAFEERTREYISSFDFSKFNASSLSEGESQAINQVIEDESFALEKISALLEKTNAMLSTLSQLTANYSELEEKTRAIADSMKNSADTQRALAREIQGIQATQKVIGVDQLKLAEEQTIVLEAQKSAISRQAELNEIENAVSNEINALVGGASQALEELKSGREAQSEVANSLGEILAANEKLLELQKNLEQRQSELTDMQRDALLAHKRLARSQKAVNERSGLKIKSRAGKFEDEKHLSGDEVKNENFNDASTENSSEEAELAAFN